MKSSDAIVPDKPVRSASMTPEDEVLCGLRGVVVRMSRPNGKTYFLRVKEENLSALVAAAGVEFEGVVK